MRVIERLWLESEHDGVCILKSGVPMRLTDERWAHITENIMNWRPPTGVAETVANPTEIFAGNRGEWLAVRVEPEHIRGSLP
jgi:hypothetical protein